MTRRGIRVFSVAACAAAMIGMGGTAASAGEIGGSGNYTPVNPDPLVEGEGVAASECAFSGLNDEYVLGDTSFSRVQNYAKTKAELAEIGIVLPKGLPGFACNPSGKRG